uniref:Uncharacterized protein n=1 Tax=Anguilla anguilla TaxID=7936 RepID=A0A0E9PME9_ANGAN
MKLLKLLDSCPAGMGGVLI